MKTVKIETDLVYEKTAAGIDIPDPINVKMYKHQEYFLNKTLAEGGKYVRIYITNFRNFREIEIMIDAEGIIIDTDAEKITLGNIGMGKKAGIITK